MAYLGKRQHEQAHRSQAERAVALGPNDAENTGQSRDSC